MNRTQLYLAGLLLVQIVLILIFRSPFTGASTDYESRALLPALDAITPSQVEILGPDEDSIKLTRRDGAWGIDDLGGFPADGAKIEKIESMLDDLKNIRVRRPVVSSTRYHASFKVAADDHEARIRLWDESEGDPDVDLIVGSSPNFRTSHVRLAGEDVVYEARGVSPYDIRPAQSSWIDRELIDADETGVVGVVVSNEAGSFELVKQEGIWTVSAPAHVEDADLDQGKVDSLVRAAADIRLDDGTGPVDDAAHGLANPAATLVLRVQDAEGNLDETAAVREVTVRIGDHPEDDESKRYITRDGFGFTGTTWESSVRRLLEEKLEELYQ
jgi:hypothetical protein